MSQKNLSLEKEMGWGGGFHLLDRMSCREKEKEGMMCWGRGAEWNKADEFPALRELGFFAFWHY